MAELGQVHQGAVRPRLAGGDADDHLHQRRQVLRADQLTDWRSPFDTVCWRAKISPDGAWRSRAVLASATDQKKATIARSIWRSAPCRRSFSVVCAWPTSGSPFSRSMRAGFNATNALN